MGKIINVTIADVARKAGVCAATVSLALRHHASIPPATREKIIRVAERVGYRPHATISALMARIRSTRAVRSQEVIAAVTFWQKRRDFDGSYSWRGYYHGAEKRADQLGYRLEEFWLGAADLSEARLSQILETRHIDGVIVFPGRPDNRLRLDWRRFAGVTIGYTLQEPPLHRVSTSHYEAVITALRELKARGYRRIGMAVDQRLNDRIERKWLAAFAAYQDVDGSSDQDGENVVVLRDGEFERFVRWVETYKPDALLFDSAVPAPAWVKAMDRQVPQDLALASVSEHWGTTGVACIDERSEEVGAAAVDVVVEQLHRNERGVPDCRREIFITGQWQEGATLRASALAH